jgi:hypothetical protein
MKFPMIAFCNSGTSQQIVLIGKIINQSSFLINFQADKLSDRQLSDQGGSLLLEGQTMAWLER